MWLVTSIAAGVWLGSVSEGVGFLVADANVDGMLSHEEVQQAVQKCFDKTDSNNDGWLDQVELNQAVVNLEQKLKRGVAALAKVKRETMLKRWERFTAADTNHDGTLSKVEAPALLKQHFDKIDANNDSQIEQSELKKAIDTWGRK